MGHFVTAVPPTSRRAKLASFSNKCFYLPGFTSHRSGTQHAINDTTFSLLTPPQKASLDLPMLPT